MLMDLMDKIREHFQQQTERREHVAAVPVAVAAAKHLLRFQRVEGIFIAAA